MKLPSVLLGLALTVAVAACRPTYSSYLATRSARVATVRTSLQSIANAAQTAPPVTERTGSCPTSVRIDRSVGFGPEHFGDTQVYLLDDMGALIHGTPFASRSGLLDALSRMHSGHGLATVLGWAARPSRVTIDERTQHFVDGMLGTRYVVVLRPRAATPGEQWVDLFVGNLANGHIECAFAARGTASTSATGETYDRVRVNTRTGERQVIGSEVHGGYDELIVRETTHAIDDALRSELHAAVE